MRFSSFFIRDSSSGAEIADEDETAADDGDCIEVAAAGAVVLWRGALKWQEFSTIDNG